MSKKDEMIVVTKPYRDKEISGYSSLVNVIKDLQDILEQATKEGWKDLAVDYRYPDPYSDSERACIIGKRPETEKEKQARFDREQATIEWQRKQFQELKKKFEP